LFNDDRTSTIQHVQHTVITFLQSMTPLSSINQPT